MLPKPLSRCTKAACQIDMQMCNICINNTYNNYSMVTTASTSRYNKLAFIRSAQCDDSAVPAIVPAALTALAAGQEFPPGVLLVVEHAAAWPSVG